jgi:hypothetical protein
MAGLFSWKDAYWPHHFRIDEDERINIGREYPAALIVARL